MLQMFLLLFARAFLATIARFKILAAFFMLLVMVDNRQQRTIMFPGSGLRHKFSVHVTKLTRSGPESYTLNRVIEGAVKKRPQTIKIVE